MAPSTASSASRLWGGTCSGTGRSQSRRACLPGSALAIATALLFAVQAGVHLLDVDGQVLTVGGAARRTPQPGSGRSPPPAGGWCRGPRSGQLGGSGGWGRGGQGRSSAAPLPGRGRG